MVKIGKYNTLKINKIKDLGAFLDGGDAGEILLPSRYLPEEKEAGDEVTVFLYKDSEDRLIATTEKPYAQIGEVAFLKLINKNKVGAFFEWGLSKDLFMSFREQKHGMYEGQKYPVYIYLDENSDRIAASAKLDNFIADGSKEYEEGKEVELFISKKTSLGFKAIINNDCYGMLFKNEVFKDLDIGSKCTGYIKQIRTDGKIDLTLNKKSKETKEELTERILNLLNVNDGFYPLNDKSYPEDIYAVFEVSKKQFKRAIGSLYKQRKIEIEENGISLVR